MLPGSIDNLGNNSLAYNIDAIKKFQIGDSNDPSQLVSVNKNAFVSGKTTHHFHNED